MLLWLYGGWYGQWMVIKQARHEGTDHKKLAPERFVRGRWLVNASVMGSEFMNGKAYGHKNHPSLPNRADCVHIYIDAETLASWSLPGTRLSKYQWLNSWRTDVALAIGACSSNWLVHCGNVLAFRWVKSIQLSTTATDFHQTPVYKSTVRGSPRNHLSWYPVCQTEINTPLPSWTNNTSSPSAFL